MQNSFLAQQGRSGALILYRSNLLKDEVSEAKRGRLLSLPLCKNLCILSFLG